MAKVQTRRSISISGAAYSKLKEYCRIHGKSLSRMTEETLLARLGEDIPLRQELGKKESRVLGRSVPGPGDPGEAKTIEMDEATRAARKAADRIFSF
jgi:hypothetical protein